MPMKGAHTMSEPEVEPGSSRARSGQSSAPELQLINDWAELHEAVEELSAKGLDFGHQQEAIRTVIDLVPRLLTQYDSLLETSYALTEGWEAYVKVHPPTGLYLPGNG